MDVRRALGLALLAVVILGAIPGAAGHAAPEPLANEEHVIADDAQDEFYWYDGYDLHHLHTREAYWAPLDTTGVVFRFTLYGGFAPGGTAQALHVDIEAETADGPQTVRFTTTDDRNWTSQTGVVLFADVTEDRPPFTGVTSRMQVMIPYDALGAEPGDALQAITMRSYADEDLRDEAPGGIFLPGSGGRVEVPTESQRLVDALDLDGPSGYLDVSVDTAGDVAAFTVENVLDNGQHVTVEAAQTPGWNVSYEGAWQASLEPNGSVELQVQGQAAPNTTRPLPVHVTSDLGAHRVYYLGVNGTEVATGLTPASVEVVPQTPTNESPGATLFVALSAIAVAVALAGRRPRA